MSNIKQKAITTAGPESEPLTKPEVKLHMGIAGEDDDNRLDQVIAAARLRVERVINRRLIEQTVSIYSDLFPSGNVYDFQIAPISAIASVQYYDVDGTLQTFAATKYYADTINEPGRLVLVDGESWPDTQTSRPGAVIVTVTAGYGPDAADVPEGIVTAMLMMIEKALDRPDENYLKALDRVQINELSPYMLRRFQ